MEPEPQAFYNMVPGRMKPLLYKQAVIKRRLSGYANYPRNVNIKAEEGFFHKSTNPAQKYGSFHPGVARMSDWAFRNAARMSMPESQCE